jgi:hypothetical protein
VCWLLEKGKKKKKSKLKGKFSKSHEQTLNGKFSMNKYSSRNIPMDKFPMVTNNIVVS